MKRKLFIVGIFIIISLMMFSACARDELINGGEELNGEEDNNREVVNGEEDTNGEVENGEDHGHEHGDDLIEWSAAYDLPAGEYILEFQESEKDPSILIAFLLEIADEHELEHMAYHVMEFGGEEVKPGGKFTAKNQFAYNLILDPQGTTFTFDIQESGRYVIFTEHFAWEFDMKIFDGNGNEIVGENEKEYAEPHEH